MGKLIRIFRQVKNQISEMKGLVAQSALSISVIAAVIILPVTDSMRAAILLSIIMFNVLRMR